jgi:hypothetical protein
MASISMPADFQIDEVRFGKKKLTPTEEPPLGVLENFQGSFHGFGFNSIFRPNSKAPTTTEFPNPVTPPPPQVPSENVLEINLTKETLAFSKSIGNVPNRGLIDDNDIFLNGVPYVQSINDVTNDDTGKANYPPTAIHFEPGLWMNVPPTANDPVLANTLVRMASIPHGTTINASGLAPTTSFTGPPDFTKIPKVDITPFPIGTDPTNPQNLIRFKSQTATNNDTPRLPQDLTKFIATGTITQAILDNPNQVLANAIEGQNITKTIVFLVSTNPSSPDFGGGTANIAFLEGASNSANGPNAFAAQMTATFWIETVQVELYIPVWKPGQPPLKLSPSPHKPGAIVPVFVTTPPHEIKEPKTITVTFTQIQYSQVVILNFAKLSWPHASVATLVPKHELPVPPSAWN